MTALEELNLEAWKRRRHFIQDADGNVFKTIDPTIMREQTNAIRFRQMFLGGVGTPMCMEMHSR